MNAIYDVYFTYYDEDWHIYTDTSAFIEAPTKGKARAFIAKEFDIDFMSPMKIRRVGTAEESDYVGFLEMEEEEFSGEAYVVHKLESEEE